MQKVVKVRSGGITVPANMRKALELEPGDSVALELDNGRLALCKATADDLRRSKVAPETAAPAQPPSASDA